MKHPGQKYIYKWKKKEKRFGEKEGAV